MSASNSFNRTTYLLMRANNISHQEMHNEYENLIKMNQRQGAVKFNENEVESDEVFAHLTIPLYETKSPQNGLKREHTDTEGSSSEFQGEFRRPSRKLFKSETSNQPVPNDVMASKSSNLNETLVLSTASGTAKNLPLPVIRPTTVVKNRPPSKCRPITQINRNKENSSTLGTKRKFFFFSIKNRN